MRKEGLGPWIDDNSEILILGSLPSDISIQGQSYYHNKPKNSFWKLMHAIFGEGDDTKEFLLSHRIALWDCLAAANRDGSLDANFRGGEVPNDISQLLKQYPNIKKIVINGITAPQKYFKKYFSDLYNHYEIVVVPSSSNLNAIPFEEKLQAWKEKILF